MSFQEAESKVTPRRIDAPHLVGRSSTEREAVEAPKRELATAGKGTASLGRTGYGEDAVSETDSETFHSEQSEDLASLTPTGDSSLLELDDATPELPTTNTASQEQLEHQAAQLASQLQEQLRDLEHREALQNVRAAELDNEFRKARLWAAERHAELLERENAIAAAEAELRTRQNELILGREQAEQSLAQKETLACQRLSEQLQQHEELHRQMEARNAALAQKEQELASSGQEIQERDAALAARELQLESKEAHLRERRQFIEREAAALHHARQEWESSHQAEQDGLAKERAEIRRELETALKGREEALAAGESLLSEQTRKLEEDRQALARERADWQRQKVADREAIGVLRSRIEAELEQRRARLTTREAALDQQQAALDQLRGEITAAHRQSIEMRLMAEQLWAQVQGRMPPLEITQSIAQLRLKLGEQYKMEQQSLGERKQELLALAEKVAEQSNTLRTQRHELQSWFAAREQEIERHAEALVLRERELLEQSDRQRESETRWNSDRRQMEQEVREVRSRLRQTAA